MKKELSICAIAVLSVIPPASAQWLNLKTPGIPRTKEGRADLSAPAPRLPDGKPDLGGIWLVHGLKYLINIAADLKEVPFQPWAIYRQIFMDGRPLPTDPNPTWQGYSIGHWDGDTLVVETSGSNGKAWLDTNGHPVTDALNVTERFHRKDLGHMDLQITIDDPKAYTKPWTVTEGAVLQPDDELIEYICEENNRDVGHFVDK